MTHKDFMLKVIRYYGKYPREFLYDSVYTYLLKTYPEKELELLWELIQKNYTEQFNKQPDIAAIEKIRKEYNEEHDDSYEFAGGKTIQYGKTIGNGNDKYKDDSNTNKINNNINKLLEDK